MYRKLKQKKNPLQLLEGTTALLEVDHLLVSIEDRLSQTAMMTSRGTLALVHHSQLLGSNTRKGLQAAATSAHSGDNHNWYQESEEDIREAREKSYLLKSVKLHTADSMVIHKVT